VDGGAGRLKRGRMKGGGEDGKEGSPPAVSGQAHLVD